MPEVADGTTYATVEEDSGGALSCSLPLYKDGGDSGIPWLRWLEPVWCVELGRWKERRR
jgi:hypothetical protein